VIAEGTAAAVIAGTAPRGFRFAVTKAAEEQAPPDLDKQIYDAAREGKIDELLDLCQEWAGHPVIDAYKNNVSSTYNTRTYLLARLLTKQLNP